MVAYVLEKNERILWDHVTGTYHVQCKFSRILPVEYGNKHVNIVIYDATFMVGTCDTVRLSACILCNIMSLYLIAV